MEYFNVTNREKSFNAWPLEKPKGITLAKNGFYYLGEGDQCRCNYCGVIIAGWKKWHDVTQRHDKLTSFCPKLTDLYDKQGRSYSTPEKGYKYLMKHNPSLFLRGRFEKVIIFFVQYFIKIIAFLIFRK